MLTTLLASPLITYGLTLIAGLGAYPVVHGLVTKVTSGVTSTVAADVATLKADVAAIKAKLPAV